MERNFAAEYAKGSFLKNRDKGRRRSMTLSGPSKRVTTFLRRVEHHGGNKTIPATNLMREGNWIVTIDNGVNVIEAVALK